jgi:hypothetical protein
VRVLEGVRDRLGRDITVRVFPDLNHSWVRNGSICQESGPGGMEGIVHFSWLAERFEHFAR